MDISDVESLCLCLLGNVTSVRQCAGSVLRPFDNDAFNDDASVITASNDVHSYVVKTGPAYQQGNR